MLGSYQLATAQSARVPAGEFLRRPGMPGRDLGVAARIGVAAAALAALSLIGAVAALLLWVVSVLLPVAIGAGFIAYAAFRIQSGSRLGSPHAG